ncbi:MAG: hypothetical protein ACKVP3_09515 [Hyphomicrobiaceae bacterium]
MSIDDTVIGTWRLSEFEPPKTGATPVPGGPLPSCWDLRPFKPPAMIIMGSPGRFNVRSPSP